jgi:hypothetical protein
MILSPGLKSASKRRRRHLVGGAEGRDTLGPSRDSGGALGSSMVGFVYTAVFYRIRRIRVPPGSAEIL